MTRVAFLNTHPIQYFAPLYAYLNQTLDLEVSAIYLSDYSIRGAVDQAFGQSVKWDVDLLAGYEPLFVSGAAERNQAQGFLSVLAPGVWNVVRRGEIDALVVHGHTPAAMLVGIAAAKSAGIPVFIRGETHLGLPRSALKAALRRRLLSSFYLILDGALAIGTANAAFYRSMGMPMQKIFEMPYAVDNARFATASRLTADDRRQQRLALGVDNEAPAILFAAKFQPRKRADDLIRAAALLAGEGLRFNLVLVGSGQMEAELRELSATLGLANVSFPGFANQSRLPQIYAASEIFVLPSISEPWGLAVNEAMCAGLPIVVSDELGCVPDLLRQDVNGSVFRAGDVAALAGALRPLILDPRLRTRMGASSRAIISGWSYAECLSGLRSALASVGLRATVAERMRNAGTAAT